MKTILHIITVSNVKVKKIEVHRIRTSLENERRRRELCVENMRVKEKGRARDGNNLIAHYYSLMKFIYQQTHFKYFSYKLLYRAL
jgi:hypothetical protein